MNLTRFKLNDSQTQKLYLAKINQGFTKEGAARLLEISPMSLYRYFNANPSFKTKVEKKQKAYQNRSGKEFIDLETAKAIAKAQVITLTANYRLILWNTGTENQLATIEQVGLLTCIESLEPKNIRILLSRQLYKFNSEVDYFNDHQLRDKVRHTREELGREPTCPGFNSKSFNFFVLATN